MLIFCDNIIFTQRQISTALAEMSDLSLLWKLRKTVMALIVLTVLHPNEKCDTGK